MNRDTLGLVATCLGLAACNGVTTPRSDVAVPVIQGLLVTGETRHSFSITWSVPADSPFVFQGPPRPVAPGDVSLRILGPGGQLLPMVSIDAAAGAFEVNGPILPETRYDLEGTVSGQAVSATVVTPGPFVVTSPASDTIRNPANSAREIPYQWRAAGAVAFVAKPFVAGVLPATDSTGILSFLDPFGTASITFLALERHAVEFFRPQAVEPRSGNITGALGVVGAASSARRVFIWQ